MSALHFRKTSDLSTALDCSVLPPDFYPYVDCFEMTMINVTVLKVIRQDAQLSQRDRAAGCATVFAKSRRLELGDNILRTL